MNPAAPVTRNYHPATFAAFRLTSSGVSAEPKAKKYQRR